MYRILSGPKVAFLNSPLMGKPEALITSGRSEVQKYNVFKNSHLQPAGDGQPTPAESGQG